MSTIISPNTNDDKLRFDNKRGYMHLSSFYSFSRFKMCTCVADRLSRCRTAFSATVLDPALFLVRSNSFACSALFACPKLRFYSGSAAAFQFLAA